jgi:hypothetical protein
MVFFLHLEDLGASLFIGHSEEAKRAKHFITTRHNAMLPSPPATPWLCPERSPGNKSAASQCGKFTAVS